jgi:segregation and condensation protein B
VDELEARTHLDDRRPTLEEPRRARGADADADADARGHREPVVTTDAVPTAMPPRDRPTRVDPARRSSSAAAQGLEALLFLADEPLSVESLAEVLEPTPPVVEATLEAPRRELRGRGRGIEIRRVAGGWRMYTAAGARPS